MKRKTVFSGCLAALFAAFLVVLSQVSVLTPLNVPLTLQLFGVALAGYTLGSRWAIASTGVYILLGAIGIPVFSGFKGGFQVIAGPTGGFICGFILLAAVCGLSLKAEKGAIRILTGILGVVLCHLWGVVQLCIASGSGFLAALLSASLPFILKDFLLVGAAYGISLSIKKAVRELR